MSLCPIYSLSGTIGTDWTRKGNDMFQLEKYKGKSTRHECPQCHDPHSFTYYVDDEGTPIDKVCGRCNHESDCGYHYTPSEFFHDNPTDKPLKPRPMMKTTKPMKSIKNINTIEQGYLLHSMFAYQIASTQARNNFDLFLRSIFDGNTIKNLQRLYFIGSPNSNDNESIIFWQVDIMGRVRAGKIIKYRRDGHRNKTTNVNWLHSELKKRGFLLDKWEVNQCLFGEHLIALFPDKQIALVESEKTAIIGAGFYPQFVWVATGGKSQLSTDKLKALAGRVVIAFPDIDGTQEWKMKLQASQVPFRKLIISDLLDKNANAEERECKIDIADWLVRCKYEGAIEPPSPQIHLDWLFDDYGNLRPLLPNTQPQTDQKPKTEFERLCENPLVQKLIVELNLQSEQVS